ncbi:MAG: molybdopterin oxidoreductase, partial [Ignavibacteria bacterium]|nr:molybdopterin oxidoreductase [Ignavibacteria bacterium]
MSDESRYWKSLRELHKKNSLDELKANEFMAGVTDDFELSNLSAMSRKQFIALLTSSAAFAAAGCADYRDKGEIVPYSKNPEEITPGVANYYASTCTGCAQACGILVKTREGRPIKIDGNPDHPVNKGKICAIGQASILNLYDPYRLRGPLRGRASGESGSLTWKQADAELTKALEGCKQSSKEIAFVTHSIHSPTAARLLREFTSMYPTTRVYVYDLFNDANRRRAWQECYGKSELPAIAWDRAKIVVALESDFLGTEGMTIEAIRKFTDGRDVMKSKDFNRLYAVEGTVSLTGANADYRLRLRPDAQRDFVLALINEIAVVRKKGSLRGPLPSQIPQISLSAFGQKHALPLEVLEHLVDDLVEHAGESIVHAGEGLPSEVHVAVNYLNELLGNTRLYESSARSVSYARLSPATEFEGLVRRMKSGDVGMVIHFGTNPVFHLPRAFEYEEALTSVPVTVSLVASEDETSRHCSFVLPVHHALESWGDFRIRTGVYSLQQPVISPLYDTRQKEAILLSWMRGAGSFNETMYHEYLMEYWEKEVFPTLRKKVDFKTFWYAALHDGVVPTGGKGEQRPEFRAEALAILGSPSGPNIDSSFVVALRCSHFVGDGEFANNGWLQEIPHPISKVVWDNYAAISPGTARELGVETNDKIEVTLPHGSQSFPVFVQPGQADGCISIELGYGRSVAGPIGTGVGTDAQILLAASSIDGPRILTGAQVVKARGRYELASTQEHHSLDDTFFKDFYRKREIVREGTVRQYEADPEFLHHEKRELLSISKEV